MTAVLTRSRGVRIGALVGVWLLSLVFIQTYLLDDSDLLPLISSPLGAAEPFIATWDGGEPAAAPPLVRRPHGDDRASLDPLYRPFVPHPKPAASPRLEPTRFLSAACMESWFIHGTIDCADPGPEDVLDLVWLWVNGSDPRWGADFDRWREWHKMPPGAQHYREQNELLYSVRSTLASFRGRVRAAHLMLYDYAFNATSDLSLLPPDVLRDLRSEVAEQGGLASESSSPDDAVREHLEQTWRVAQTPYWLDLSQPDAELDDGPAGDGDLVPRFQYVAHSEIFHVPDVDFTGAPLEAGDAAYAERAFRRRALPSYNSMSIESRFAFLPGMADVAVAFNDDTFMLKPVAVSDWHSPLFGNVIRFKPGGRMDPIPHPNFVGNSAAYGGLYAANWLLAQRFPPRPRPHLEHVSKTITRSLQQEATLLWPADVTEGSGRRFRELKGGTGDVETLWLQLGLRVERWREALLWTWVVAKLGGVDGVWGAAQREHVAELFEKRPGPTDTTVEVLRGERKTLARLKDSFAEAGWEAPKVTEYKWTSMDGHLPSSTKNFADPKEHDRCTMDLAECFDTFWTDGEDTSAAFVFKHVAYRKPECGDCLLMALVTASGPLGLSAFFPSADVTWTNDAAVPAPYVAPPHLPLTPTWQEADYSLDKVLAAASGPGQRVGLRDFTMRLLSRYIYTHATSRVMFQQLKNPESTRKILHEMVDRSGASVLCLNDDIEDGYEQIRQLVGDWFEERWPEKSLFER